MGEKFDLIGMTEKMLRKYQAQFPTLHIPREVAEAWEWLDRHPNKEYKNIELFLLNWFKKGANWQYTKKLEEDLRKEKIKTKELRKRTMSLGGRLGGRPPKIKPIQENGGWTPARKKAFSEKMILFRKEKKAGECKNPVQKKTFWGRLFSKEAENGKK